MTYNIQEGFVSFTNLVELSVFQIHACAVDKFRIYWKNPRFFFLLEETISNAEFLVY